MKKYRCSKCGYEMRKSLKFCPECGNELFEERTNHIQMIKMLL